MKELKLQIVTLEPADWKHYKKIRLEALRLEPHAFGSNFEVEKLRTDQEWEEKLRHYSTGSGNLMYFVKNKDEIVGLGGSYMKDGFAHIVAIYVRKEHRGSGAGKTLLETLLEELEKQGVKNFRTYVNKIQTTAFNLYKSLGFTAIREEKTKFGDGNEHTTILLELS